MLKNFKNPAQNGYSDVNGLRMYYEIYGAGKPLVLIHGGGSTIQTSFKNLIPLLAGTRQLIAMELQAHGRTNDRQQGLSFAQDADDVATLLKNLRIEKADFLGYSNGGQTCIEIALRQPDITNKLVIASAFYTRSGSPAKFWDGFDRVTVNDMPEVLQIAQLEVNGNDKDRLLNMFNRDVQRMKTFVGWTDADLRSIQAPTLVLNGNEDVSSPEHAVEMYRLIPDCKLAILPGGHGGYLGALEAAQDGKIKFSAAGIIDEFLD